MTPLAPVLLAAAGPVNPWVIVIPGLLAAATVAMLLPNPKSSAAVGGGGAALGVVTLLVMGLVWTKPAPYPAPGPDGFGPQQAAAIADSVLFYLFAGVAVVSGTLLVTHHNPVRAALSFVLVVLSVCGLFLLQAAPFLMAATMIVYAGAIVVTFLFVIMLAQQLGYSDADLRTHERWFSGVAGAALLVTLVVVLLQSESAQGLQGFQTFPVEKAAALVERTRKAAAVTEASPEETFKKVVGALENEGDRLFDDYRQYAEADRGSAAGRNLLAFVRDHQTDWDDAKKKQNPADLKGLLRDLADRGQEVVARHTPGGKPRLPAENTAAIGVSLFTDYFLAVELGGSLLLIATVGAVAVTARRPDPVKPAGPAANHAASRAEGQV